MAATGDEARQLHAVASAPVEANQPDDPLPLQTTPPNAHRAQGALVGAHGVAARPLRRRLQRQRRHGTLAAVGLEFAQPALDGAPLGLCGQPRCELVLRRRLPPQHLRPLWV